jgi:hypothetical protein
MDLKEIESDGWVKGDKYRIRGLANEWEYEKMVNETVRRITIDFDERGDIRQIFTLSRCRTRTIKDMEDLKYFFENNK